MKIIDPDIKQRPCIICEKQLEVVITPWTNKLVPSDIHFAMIIGGVQLCSSGGYGSKLLDDEDGSGLYFVICDECLKSRAHLMIFLQRIDNDNRLLNAAEVFSEIYFSPPLLPPIYD